MTLTNAQFVKCKVGFSAVNGRTNVVDNALFAGVITNFSMPNADATIIKANNVTFANASALLNYDNGTTGDARTGFGGGPLISTATVFLTLTNCILANVTNVDGVTAANYNGFFQTPMIGITTFTNPFYPFKAVGAGSYYLTNGCTFTNEGTVSIGQPLLVDLAARTTCPPLVYSNATISVNTNFTPEAQRDTDAPDLGYHYDPIDYLIENYTITNATLTVASGTVIACYNDNGIWLQDGSTISSIGTSTAPNWFTYYLSVQEQPVSFGAFS